MVLSAMFLLLSVISIVRHSNALGIKGERWLIIL